MAPPIPEAAGGIPPVRTRAVGTGTVPAAWRPGPARAARPARPEPDFGPHVREFGPGTPSAEIRAALDAAAAGPATGHHTFLFRPGAYRVDARLGAGTRIAGLGLSPRDVTIHGVLRPAAGPRMDGRGGGTDGSASHGCGDSAGERRGADHMAAGLRPPVENLTVVSSGQTPAPLGGDLAAPGGNSAWCGGSSPDGGRPTPGKPFLYVDGTGSHRVFLPAPRSTDPGPSDVPAGVPSHGWSVPLDRFHIARPGDSVHILNRALAQGLHLLLTPGVYRLTGTVRVKWSGTVVLGLGLAVLAPVGGTVPMTVSDVRGVRIAGLLFDAGPATPPVLLELGRSVGGRSDPREPAAVQDVFFRIHGADEGRAATALVVNSDHVRLDGVWAWRAGRDTGPGRTADGTGPGAGAPGPQDGPGARFHDLRAAGCDGPGVRARAIDGGGGAAQGTASVTG